MDKAALTLSSNPPGYRSPSCTVYSIHTMIQELVLAYQHQNKQSINM